MSAQFKLVDETNLFKVEGADVIAPLAAKAQEALDRINTFTTGPTGPANNTFPTLLAFKAQPSTNKVSSLRVDGLDRRFVFLAGDFSGTALAKLDNIVIKADDTALTAGAWIGDNETRLSVRTFGAIGGRDDETIAVAAAVNAAIALGGVTLDFEGLDLRVGLITYSNAQNVTFVNGTIRPLAADKTSGRFTASSGWSGVKFQRMKFLQTAATNYQPAIYGFDGTGIEITDCVFDGCGAGWKIQQVTRGTIGRNTYRQVGVYPRPAPLDATGAGFSAAFEIYGFGGRGTLCNDIHVFDEDFENVLAASGCLSDVTGGPGGISFDQSNNCTIAVKRVINAPGQGALFTGAWQGVDVVGQVLAGTLVKTLNGRGNRIKGGFFKGCNQEGATLFGCGESHIEWVSGENSRACMLEIWDGWGCTGTMLNGKEDIAANHPINTGGFGAVGGRGVMHCINSAECDVSGNVTLARYNGISFSGSLRCRLLASTVLNYGAENDPAASFSSGVECGTGTFASRNADQIDINDSTFIKAAANTTGATIFTQVNTQVVRHKGLVTPGATVTYAGGPQSIYGSPPEYFRGGITGGGINPTLPGWKKVSGAQVTVGTVATTILTMVPMATSFDPFELTVTGVQTTNSAVTFADRIRAAKGVAAVQVIHSWNQNAGATARTYDVDVATGNLRLAMAAASPDYKVSANGEEYASLSL